MTTREEAMTFGLSLPETYADMPFHDDNWMLLRRRDNRRTFLCIFHRNDHIWLNLKCEPEMGVLWRSAYASIHPAYHMNKEHWISVILDGSIPDELIMSLIETSYTLVRPKKSTTHAVKAQKTPKSNT